MYRQLQLMIHHKVVQRRALYLVGPLTVTLLQIHAESAWKTKSKSVIAWRSYAQESSLSRATRAPICALSLKMKNSPET